MTNPRYELVLKPLHVDGVPYTASAINAVRTELLSYRDAALNHCRFHEAMNMSKAAALLDHLAMNTEDAP